MIYFTNCVNYVYSYIWSIWCDHFIQFLIRRSYYISRWVIIIEISLEFNLLGEKGETRKQAAEGLEPRVSDCSRHKPLCHEATTETSLHNSPFQRSFHNHDTYITSCYVYVHTYIVYELRMNRWIFLTSAITQDMCIKTYSHAIIYMYVYMYTVGPLNKGHIRTRKFVHCREVVHSSEVKNVLAL